MKKKKKLKNLAKRLKALEEAFYEREQLEYIKKERDLKAQYEKLMLDSQMANARAVINGHDSESTSNHFC